MRHDINSGRTVFFSFFTHLPFISLPLCPVPSSQTHAFLFKSEVEVRRNIRNISYGGMEGPLSLGSKRRLYRAARTGLQPL